MARGGTRSGSGRKNGSLTRRTAEIAKKAAENGQTPLEYMLDIMRAPMPTELSLLIQECQESKTIDVEVLARLTSWHGMRFEAAKASAPYMHPRLQAHEVSGKDGGPIEISEIKRVVVDG